MKSRFLEMLDNTVASRGGAICFASLNEPIPDQWNDYVTQSPVALEVIQDVLYDTLTYTSAVTTELIFFAESIATVTRDVTNMTVAGMLPNPESFLIQAPRLFFKVVPTISASNTALTTNIVNDIALLVNTGIVTFKFGNKTYGPIPLWLLSAGNAPDMRLAAAGASATDGFAGYAQVGGPLFSFFPHIMISPLQAFTASMTWPAGAVTLGAGNPKVSLLFDGQRARAVQ
jgi:hypothetical protein